ncbi:phosphatase PAP2 family protein [Flavobacterium sp.]|uniref:phosphatase PAP2 family protein n=1 Tax=Flavobacterium sp. TaxID=239 RepID=UPI00286DAF82|nr:phosphatase PAP2 family protein [Flavobacterium sp.]
MIEYCFNLKKNILITSFFLYISLSSFAQIATNNIANDSTKVPNNIKLNYKQLVIPTVLIGYGFIGLESHQLLSFNTEIKAEVKEHIDDKLTIDDFSQYAPLVSIYAIDAMGIKSKNCFKDKVIISATSYLIMGLAVNTLKKTSVSERPDGTSANSFPSGHTATAFMGAELLFQEYKDKSFWYGLSGYVVATGTGIFRIYNNKHWLTDVAAGAGIGILSAKAAYWLHPTVSKIFNKKQSKTATTFIPFYDGKTTGFGMVSTF